MSISRLKEDDVPNFNMYIMKITCQKMKQFVWNSLFCLMDDQFYKF